MKSIKTLIDNGAIAQGYELAQADIGKALDHDSFGPVQRVDVGKRVWSKSYGLAMENNQQRDERISGKIN
jgi:hypothetical protein